MSSRKLAGAFFAAVAGTATAAAGGSALLYFGKTALVRIPVATDSFDASMHMAGLAVGAALAVQAAQISGSLFRYARNRIHAPS